MADFNIMADLKEEPQQYQEEKYNPQDEADKQLFKDLIECNGIAQTIRILYNNTNVLSVKLEPYADEKDQKEQIIQPYANTWMGINVDHSKKCDAYRKCDLVLPEEFADGVFTYNIELDRLVIPGDLQNSEFVYDRFIQEYMNKEFLREYKITLFNESGFNPDHRGSDHTRITIPFYDSYTLRKNTVSELLQGMYHVKSHKFDDWYELFHKARVYVKGKCIKIVIDFDHGS